ncbi:hypothetical protein [Aeromonas hydrophila]
MTNKLSPHSFTNIAMFINTHLVRHDVSRNSDKSKYNSFYGIKNIVIKNNKSNHTVTLEKDQDFKSVGNSLTAIGIPSRDNSFGKSIRKRVKSAVNTSFGEYDPAPSFYAAVEQIANVTRVWIVDANLDRNPDFGRVYATIICVQATKNEETGAVSFDTFKEDLRDRNGAGRFFKPSVKTGTTMTHHLNAMNKIEMRGGARVKSKLTETATPVEVAAVVNETIDVVNETAETVDSLVEATAEVSEVVNETAETVSKMQSKVSDMEARMLQMEALLRAAGIKVPAPAPVEVAGLDQFFVDGPVHVTDALDFESTVNDIIDNAVSDRAFNDPNPNLSSVTRFQSH